MRPGFGISSAKICAIGGLILFSLAPAQAAKTRNELLFQLNAALLANDRAAFARCFNFAGTDGATRKSFERIFAQIFSWPTHHVFSTERSRDEQAPIVQNGRSYRLNGAWQFQVHVFLSKKTSTGFVFPAGTANGQALVLIAVPEGA